MQFPFNFQLVFFSGSSLSIHTFRHLKHQDRTIFKPRGSKTLIYHYFLDNFNFARNNANFHNDARGCPNRCIQILKAENVYYKDQQRAKRGFFMKKTTLKSAFLTNCRTSMWLCITTTQWKNTNRILLIQWIISVFLYCKYDAITLRKQ